MAVEGQDEEVELGSAGKEGRMNHDWEGKAGAQRIHLEMLPEKLGKSLGRHVLIWEPGYISALGIGSHLESAHGKAGIRRTDNCFMGCQSCPLEKVRFVKEETASRKALLAPCVPALSYTAKGECLEGWLSFFFFFKVIDLKLSFSVWFCADTERT